MFDDLDICKSVSWSSNHHLAAMIWIRIPKKDTKHEASHGLYLCHFRMTGFNFQQAFQHLQVIPIIFISFSQFRLFKTFLQTLHHLAGLESRVGQSYRHDAEAWPVGWPLGWPAPSSTNVNNMGIPWGNDGKWAIWINLNGFWGYCWFLRWLAKPQGAGLLNPVWQRGWYNVTVPTSSSWLWIQLLLISSYIILYLHIILYIYIFGMRVPCSNLGSTVWAWRLFM